MPVLSRKETAESLGDRSDYVGASDIGKCFRQAVLSKLYPVRHSLETLVQFKMGHLIETILMECFDQAKIKYKTQFEAVYPDNPHIKCHIDFLFHNQSMSKIGILECKSTKAIPDEPYETWVNQVQFQIGLVKQRFPNADVYGKIIVIDRATGDIKLFDQQFRFNMLVFNALIEKGKRILKAVENKVTDDLETSESFLCGYCAFKNNCPRFTGDETTVPDDLKAAVEKYKQLSEKKRDIADQIEDIKNNILNFTGENYFAKWDGNKLVVKTVESKRIKTSKLKKEFPEVYEEVVGETTTSTRLRIT